MRTTLFGFLYRIFAALALISILAFGQVDEASAGSIIYVKAGATGLHNGTSWANAFPSLQQALNIVVSGQQIWVAKGIYKPKLASTFGNARSKTFTLKDGVAIYGGFAGTETLLKQRKPSVNVTFLSGDLGVAGVATDNAYHVVRDTGTSSATILDGFTISGGNANSANPSDDFGGGMYSGGNATLRNLVFSHNAAASGGGAMYVFTNPTLNHVTFNSNTAPTAGAVYNVGSGTWTNIAFNGNTASGDGGAMYNNDGGSPIYTNVSFNNNSAGGNGGGLNNFNTVGSTMLNVTFSNNTAIGNGGALYNVNSNPMLTNATFSANSATGSTSLGGAIYDNNATTGLQNATFSGNSAVAVGGAIYGDGGSSTQAADSIFWNDGAEFGVAGASTIGVLDSIVAGTCPSSVTCSNVRSADPKLGPLRSNGGFTKTMALGTGSSAIDAVPSGDSCAVRDQRGVLRPQGAACDIGAYEVRAQSFISDAAYDGQITESKKLSGIGGTVNSTGPTITVGDDALNRRERGFLSFSTAPIPDGATVIMARLEAFEETTGGDPNTVEGHIQVDLSAPYFGTQLGLVSSDFNVAASYPNVGTLSFWSGGWYMAALSSTGRAHLNKYGSTQFRLGYSTEQYNGEADYRTFDSGDALTSNRPVLWVYYNP